VTSLALPGRVRARRRRAAAATCGLAFDRPGGPLVAVCGVAGGAGTSTLALALAERVAAESQAAVLLCEADSGAGALAELAGVESSLSLGALAHAVLAGTELAGPPFAQRGRLRLIAGRASAPPGDPEQVRQLLEEARRAHGLVVCDGGLVGSHAASPVLASATALVLVVPATPPGVRRAERVFAGGLVPRKPLALAAVALGADSVRSRELRRLAERHAERLVLVPHVAALARGDQAIGELDLVLAGLATWLTRSGGGS
jgi:hypothetical protein